MKVFCNCCGKEIQIKENTQIALEDYITIEKIWGYFSKKDGIRQKMVVCEDCFDAWTGTFAQPPQEIQERELL
ncbi:MAG: hypothetical protein K2P45_03095 [Eubacterium sp.]|nr:hypothetical protein [Eubacterium sp.]